MAEIILDYRYNYFNRKVLDYNYKYFNKKVLDYRYNYFSRKVLDYNYNYFLITNSNQIQDHSPKTISILNY